MAFPVKKGSAAEALCLRLRGYSRSKRDLLGEGAASREQKAISRKKNGMPKGLAATREV